MMELVFTRGEGLDKASRLTFSCGGLSLKESVHLYEAGSVRIMNTVPVF